jgi:phage protein U
MAVIGALGDIIFSVSNRTVYTFDKMKWASSAPYAKHDRIGLESLLEFTGTDADTISFTMYFSAFLGVNPIAEISKFLKAERDGQVMMLVIGPKAYGRHRWVITKSSRSLESVDNAGLLIAAGVDVTLGAYASR